MDLCGLSIAGNRWIAFIYLDLEAVYRVARLSVFNSTLLARPEPYLCGVFLHLASSIGALGLAFA